MIRVHLIIVCRVVRVKQVAYKARPLRQNSAFIHLCINIEIHYNKQACLTLLKKLLENFDFIISLKRIFCWSFKYKVSYTFNNTIIVYLSQLSNDLDSSSCHLFTMESMRFVSFFKFGTKTRRFSKGKIGKACLFEGRTRTLKISRVAPRHFRKKMKPDLKSAPFRE